MYLLLADQGFSLPPHPSSEEEEVFDVSSQKQKKQTKFIIHITISFKNKASRSLQSFQAKHGKSCYHSVCKSNLDAFHFFFFFTQSGILGSHSVLGGVLLPKYGLKYNPAFWATNLIVQRRAGRYSNHSQETSAPAAQYYQSTLQHFNSDLPKQLTLSKQPCMALPYGWAAAKHSVLGCWVQLRSGVYWPQVVQTGPNYLLDKIKHRFKAPHC